MVADDAEELVADEPEVPVLELVTQESPREEAGDPREEARKSPTHPAKPVQKTTLLRDGSKSLR